MIRGTAHPTHIPTLTVLLQIDQLGDRGVREDSMASTASTHSDLRRTRPRPLIEAAHRQISSASRLCNRRVPGCRAYATEDRIETASRPVFRTGRTARVGQPPQFAAADLPDARYRVRNPGVAYNGHRGVGDAGRACRGCRRSGAPGATWRSAGQRHRATWVPQADLLPHVDVVVHHGGSGTTLGALIVGAPQLILPQGADQFANADALSAAGAGLRLVPDELSANAIAEHTRKLLPHHGHAAHREAACAIAEEIARMPSPDQVARNLPEYATRE